MAIEQLTYGEAEATLRRRLAMKLPRTNGRLATDKVQVASPLIHAMVEDGPEVLGDYEIAWVYRKRSGLTQAEVASMIGRSRLWVSRMESGLEEPSELIEYWETN